MSTNGVHHAADESIDSLYSFWPGVQSAPAPLPEAPVSINLRAMMGGFEVQITLRDHDESALLTRLGALLKRPDIRPVPKPAPRPGGWKKGH
jgi:hypothetical protein